MTFERIDREWTAANKEIQRLVLKQANGDALTTYDVLKLADISKTVDEHVNALLVQHAKAEDMAAHQYLSAYSDAWVVDAIDGILVDAGALYPDDARAAAQWTAAQVLKLYEEMP